MYRVIATFKCTQCRAKFKAPNVEYMATRCSMPQPCPKCGSIRTRPAGFHGWTNGVIYKAIWVEMESKKSLYPA